MSKLSVQKILQKHGDEIIELRKSGMQMKDIGKKFGLKTQTISSFLVRNNIRIHSIRTQEIDETIIKMYTDGVSISNIAKKFHFSSGTISKILKENNIHIKNNSEAKRIYNINENYFKNIDTPNKAYILGLLYADGNRSKISNTISIRLQESDKSILEKNKSGIKNRCPFKIY